MAIKTEKKNEDCLHARTFIVYDAMTDGKAIYYYARRIFCTITTLPV